MYMLRNLRFRESWRRVVVAVVVALATVIVLILAYPLVVALWVWWFAYPLSSDKLDPALHLAIGQVYSGFAAIFLTVAIGFFAVLEFAERQERPRLRLLWDTMEGPPTPTLELQLPAEGKPAEEYFFSLTLHNEGNVPALWYFVELRTPFLPNAHSNLGGVVQPIIGLADGWRSFQDSPGKSGRKESGLHFHSQGNVAAFPGYPLILCQITLPADYFATPQKFVCDLQIGSEKSKVRHETLKLEVVRFKGLRVG